MLFLNSVRVAPGLRSALAVACGAALSWAPGAGAAQDVGDAVVVTATRTPTRVNELVADVTVIDRAQIEKAAGRSLASLLSDAPGVQMASNGGLGKASSVFVRGGDSKQTQLLIDGVRYGSLTTGAPSLENIPLDQIDHIEIVRGPLASLYGADAASGVIQIFTRKGHAGFTPTASLTAGSDRYYEALAGFSGGQDRVSYSLHAATTGTSGISSTNRKVGSNFNPDRDGFVQQSLSGQLGLTINEGWRLDGNVLHSYGVNYFDDGVLSNGQTPNTHADLSTAVVGLSLTGRIGSQWRTIFRLAQSEDVSDTGVANKSYNLGRIVTRQTQSTWENQFVTPLGQALFALEQLRQYADNSSTPFDVTSRTVNAVTLGLSGSHGMHDWQLNARQDNNSQFGNEATGSVGYGIKLGGDWKVAGSMGTSFVAPSFNQLYYPNYGNPDLKPQHGFNKELNLSWAPADHELRLTRYDNRIRDFILTSQTSASNLDGVRLSGWTLSGKIQQDTPVGRAFAGGSLDWLDAHNMADDSQLLRRADRFGVLRVGLERETVSCEISVKGSTGAVDYGKVHLTGYALWGAAVRYAVAPAWTLALRADNIGNHAYETAYGYSQPRSQMFLTLSYAPKSL
jgi:vitamin B12 transporter